MDCSQSLHYKLHMFKVEGIASVWIPESIGFSYVFHNNVVIQGLEVFGPKSLSLFGIEVDTFPINVFRIRDWNHLFLRQTKNIPLHFEEGRNPSIIDSLFFVKYVDFIIQLLTTWMSRITLDEQMSGVKILEVDVSRVNDAHVIVPRLCSKVYGSGQDFLSLCVSVPFGFFY